jgi:hypothetical protein
MLYSAVINFTAKITNAIDSKKCEKESETNGSVFKLPIEYLDETQRYNLQDTVCDDLELSTKIHEDMSNNIVETHKNKTMYDYLLNPTNEFASAMIPKWKTQITTNTHFLEETQEIIQTMGQYQQSFYKPDYNTIMTIWNDTKEDPNFLERYSYMELSMFKYLNKMPAFLQAISIVNMGSPILSFLIPFILFLAHVFVLLAKFRFETVNVVGVIQCQVGQRV